MKAPPATSKGGTSTARETTSSEQAAFSDCAVIQDTREVTVILIRISFLSVFIPFSFLSVQFSFRFISFFLVLVVCVLYIVLQYLLYVCACYRFV